MWGHGFLVSKDILKKLHAEINIKLCHRNKDHVTSLTVVHVAHVLKAIAAVVCLGHDNLTAPNALHASSEFIVFLLLDWLPPQGNRD